MPLYREPSSTVEAADATAGPDTSAPTAPLPGAQLASRLGHDLRGPLGGILGVTRLLLGALAAGPVDPGLLVHRLELVRSSGERLLRTVDRLVDVAGIEAAAPPPLVPFDCRVVARALVAPDPTTASGRPRPRAELPDRPVLVLGDEDSLGRLLRELLENAVAAPGAAEVRLRVHPATGGPVRIDVTDDGPGLSPPELARVLRPYERGGAESGAGLGLHVVRLLAGRLGAGLSASSEPGRGTTMTLRIPAAPSR
jgi:signal transduction histidine kinase